MSTKGQIQEAAKVDYDQKVEKGDTITANHHINHISLTLGQMIKVLSSNLSEDPEEIEEYILTPALQQVFSSLDQLYFEHLKDANSKYAKKRVKVDIKILLYNLLNGEQNIKLSMLFKHHHLNLLVSMD